MAKKLLFILVMAAILVVAVTAFASNGGDVLVTVGSPLTDRGKTSGHMKCPTF